MTIDWAKVKTSGDPILVVVLRGAGRRLTGRRIPIDQNVFEDLREVAEAAHDRVRSMELVEYSPYVGLEEGEYLGLARSALIAKPRKRRRIVDEPDAEAPSAGADETVALLTAVDTAEYAEPLGAGSIDSVSPDAFAAQAICLGSGRTRVGFVTRTNPRKVFKRSLIPLGKADEGDRLKRVASPELVLEPEVHAIVTHDEIAILNPTQFQFLVTDATLLADHVPMQVRAIEAAFTARGVKIAQSTSETITATAQSQPRLARRLAAFAERIGRLDTEALTTGRGFRSQDLKPSDFVNNAGEIECAPDRIAELLDALEGRFFSDAFSAEKRRADRFRARR